MSMSSVMWMNLYYCALSWLVSQLASQLNVICKSVSFVKIIHLVVQLLRPPDLSAGSSLLIWKSVWLPDCPSMPCFYTVFALLYFIIVLPCVIYCCLCVFLPPFHLITFWLIFIMCIVSVSTIVLDGPVWVWYWIVFMCSRIACNGSICLFVCFVVW